MQTDPTRQVAWVTDSDFTLRGTEFRATSFKGFPSTVDRFFLMKPRGLVEQYIDLVKRTNPRYIFELGIYRGGSTAFLSHLAAPERLVAVELKPEPVEALEEFVARFGYADTVKTHYGIDQADHRAVDEVYRREFGAAPLDLVLDDASHNLEHTRAAFNTLFPRLRAGGLYVIEDWAWGLFAFSREKEGTSLAVLVFELLCSLPYFEGMIDDVLVDKYWAVVRRGSTPLPEGTFDVSNCYGERARKLIVDR